MREIGLARASGTKDSSHLPLYYIMRVKSIVQRFSSPRGRAICCCLALEQVSKLVIRRSATFLHPNATAPLSAAKHQLKPSRVSHNGRTIQVLHYLNLLSWKATPVVGWDKLGLLDYARHDLSSFLHLVHDHCPCSYLLARLSYSSFIDLR